MKTDDLRIAANGWTFDRLGRLRRMGKAERKLQQMGIAVLGADLRARDYERVLREHHQWPPRLVAIVWGIQKVARR